MLAQGALQQWLGDLITVESLEVHADDATLTVTVRYIVRLTGERAEQTIVRRRSAVIYTCCDENRRAAVDAHATLNGIDYLEVLDLDAPTRIPRQQTLMVRLLKPVPAGLVPDNVRIEGGERVRDIGVDWVAPADAAPEEQALLRRAATGRPFAARAHRQRRRLQHLPPAVGAGRRRSAAPGRLRPAAVGGRPSVSKWSARPTSTAGRRRVCSEEPESTPDIDYLAKDYASFRRLMLDRLSQLVPGWRERTAADLGVTLVELLAYAADHLSYWQDAVATEAYLETARRRTSLRRLARLVDYGVHDGCNARAWVQLKVTGGPVDLNPDTVRFYTRVPGAPARIAPDSSDDTAARRHGPEVFEPMDRATLYESHNELHFYTWGDDRCCLPAGATRATLRRPPSEPCAPVTSSSSWRSTVRTTGEQADADPAHRHAVRLSGTQAFDGAAQLTDPLTGKPITEIEWDADDALPFPLCISAVTDKDHGAILVEDVSVALGNIVLCDHGRTVTEETIGTVPPSSLRVSGRARHGPLRGCDPVRIPPRFRPSPGGRPR